MMISDSIFIRSILKQPVDRTPVWLMRQAGRYLPEYRKVREKAGNFLNLCKTPELACEVTLQPLQRFDLDAAILFSDILTIPDALNLGLDFLEGEGPVFSNPIRGIKEIENLSVDVLDKLNYVMQAVSMIRHALPNNIPLIGFSGSPWTLACYMVEGKSSKDFKNILSFMYLEPAAVHLLLKKLATMVTAYLLEQIRSGVNTIMLFDTWGGILSTNNFLNFSLQYMKTIVNAIKSEFPSLPIILFTKGGGQWLQDLANTGCDVLSLDWTVDLTKARSDVGAKVSLQGNLDPSVLLSNSAVIYQEVGKVLAAYGKGSGHIFNLGHGITPDVAPENVLAMVTAVKELSPQYHGSL